MLGMKVWIVVTLAAIGTFGALCCAEKRDAGAAHDTGSKTAAVTTEVQAAAPLRDQTTCPVMAGLAIDKTLFVEQDGRRIYVCCAGCLAPIREDFDKYAAKLEADGQRVEIVPQ